MKKIFALLIILLLPACSMLNFFSSREYDPVEYNYAISLANDSTHAVHRCEKRNITNNEFNTFFQKINLNSSMMVEYVGNKKDSNMVLPAAVQIRNLVVEYFSRTNPSDTYCKHKISNVQASSRILARSLGSTDKFDACQGNVETRYTLFESSYKSKLISKEEFEELVQDLVKLKTVNDTSCSIEEKQKFNEALNLIKASMSLL